MTRSLLRRFAPGLLCAAWVAGPSPLAAAPTLRPARLILEFAPQDPTLAPASWRGTVTLRSLDTPSAEPITRKVAGKKSLVFAVPERSRWQLAVSLSGLWSPDLTIPMEGADRELTYRIRLWPAAKSEARIQIAEPGAKPPAELRLEVVPPPLPRSGAIEPEGSVACPVEANGRWRCTLPAHRPLRLAIRGAGWVPVYRQGIQANRDRAEDLGTIALVRGGSLVGWVEVDGDRIQKGKCRARIEPFQMAGGGAEVATQLRATASEVEVGPDGFFQFGALRPGLYRVGVSQPGFALASAAPLEVWAGKETRLDKTLLLHRPLRLTVAVTPTLDGFGQPWLVRIDRGADAGPALAADAHREGVTNPEGHFVVRDAAPGAYAVEVSDSRENRFYSQPSVPVEGPEEARIEIALDLIDVEGTITLGGEPLAASLWFGGRFGANRAEMSSDREGKFAGVVARAGPWKVLISAPALEIESETKVEVEPDPQGIAKVEIALPDTLLGGQVVDPEGHAVEHADVILGNLSDVQRTTSGAQGRFRFRGVATGLARLEANDRSTGRSSDSVSVDLREEGAPAPIVLRLRETRRLEGRVISSFGPVAGARVVVFPRRPVGPGQDARTDLDGSFAVDVPKSTSSAVAIVSPPGQALRAVELTPAEAPTEIPVGSAGGTLEISWLAPGGSLAEGTALSIAADGLPLSGSELAQWAIGHGEPFQTPTGLKVAHLAPGTYRACLAPKSWNGLDLPEPGQPAVHCAEGYLAAGAELVLKPAGSESEEDAP